jgi:hypothetical protein
MLGDNGREEVNGIVHLSILADREGFEPSVTLLLHTLSKRAHSTTLTPALGGRDARNWFRRWQPLFEIFIRPARIIHSPPAPGSTGDPIPG